MVHIVSDGDAHEGDEGDEGDASEVVDRIVDGNWGEGEYFLLNVDMLALVDVCYCAAR